MKSIEQITTYTTTIKKSVFITTLIPCNDEKDIAHTIALHTHADATHNCVAYIVNHHEKADDDGEPSGTAGLPMLNVLQRQGLENIIVIVTRYFGGIKLGAGGLTRAYTNSVADALKEAEIVEKILVDVYRLDVDYHYSKKIDYLIKTKGFKHEDPIYDEKVHYTLYLEEDTFIKELQEMTCNTMTYEIIGEDYIKKP